MAFVKFTETRKSYSPRASINPRGYISFNNGARKKFELEKYTNAVLYNDSEGKKIGIELTHDAAVEGAIKLRSRSTGATLGAKSFLSHFNIQLDKITIYDVSKDDASGMIIIDLSTGRERNSKDDDEGDDLTPV